MPIDLAVPSAEATASRLDLVTTPDSAGTATGERAVVIVRRRSAREAILDAERRGAPDREVRILEEAAIAASIARVRAAQREGRAVSAAQRAQFERDRELLRRFPDDRRGTHGEGWFHLAR